MGLKIGRKSKEDNEQVGTPALSEASYEEKGISGSEKQEATSKSTKEGQGKSEAGPKTSAPQPVSFKGLFR